MIEFRATRFTPPGADLTYGWHSHVGLLPSFWSEDDPRRAAEQLNERYAHGGGWRGTAEGWTLESGNEVLRGRYPDDPPFKCIAVATLRDETIRLYEPGSWIAIIQSDGSFAVDRCD